MLDKELLSLPGARRIYAAAVAFALLIGALCVGQAVGLSAAIVGIWEGHVLQEQIVWIALFSLCFILRRVVANGEDALLERFANRTVTDLRTQLLETVWEQGPAFTRKQGSATIAANAIEGMDAIESYVRMMIPKVANVAFVPFVLLIAMFGLDWVSGLIALVCYPFIILFMRLIGQSAGNEAAKRYAEFERMSAGFMDVTSGLDTLRAFGASERFANRVFAISERFRELTMKTLRIAMLSTTVLDLFATLGLAAIAIMLGFRLVDGSMQFFPALCVLMMVPEYFKPVREFGEDYHSTLEGKSALVSVLGALSVNRSDTILEESLIQDPSIQAGAKVAIVGPSGSGKTTLLNRWAGLLGERDEERISHIAYIPQQPYIFRTSLRDNVAFYAPDASDAQVLKALEAVGLGEFATTLPEGLATRIGDGGRTLSGGQTQRVAVARALLDPKRDIWLLDEPTAHLDSQTEAELIACIVPLMQGKTVAIATHNEAWLPHMDRIITLVHEDQEDSER